MKDSNMIVKNSVSNLDLYKFMVFEFKLVESRILKL